MPALHIIRQRKKIGGFCCIPWLLDRTANCCTLFDLRAGLAEYEKEPHEVEMTEETLRRDGFTEGETPLFYCLLAEADSAPAGFCLFYVAYSTWKGRYLYLEDLFVGPEYRKRGVGIKVSQLGFRPAV